VQQHPGHTCYLHKLASRSRDCADNTSAMHISHAHQPCTPTFHISRETHLFGDVYLHVQSFGGHRLEYVMKRSTVDCRSGWAESLKPSVCLRLASVIHMNWLTELEALPWLL
jgi:hypothetical protein